MHGPYYKKKDSMNYIVYFLIGFDHEPYTYNSDKKEWVYNNDFGLDFIE